MFIKHEGHEVLRELRGENVLLTTVEGKKGV